MAACFNGNTTGFSVLGLREVVPDQTGVEQWKELMLSSGNTKRIMLWNRHGQPYFLRL